MAPAIASSAPHQMGACSCERAGGLGSGCDSSQSPVTQMIVPYARSMTPQKNQIDIASRVCFDINPLPENDVQDDEDGANDTSPNDRLLIPEVVMLIRQLGDPIDQSLKFTRRPWLGRVAHHNRNQNADRPGPE